MLDDEGSFEYIKKRKPCDLNEWSDLKVDDILLPTTGDTKVPLLYFVSDIKLNLAFFTC